MPIVVDVPGVGEVDFPDNMSDDQISLAIKRILQPAAGGPDNGRVYKSPAMDLPAEAKTGIYSDIHIPEGATPAQIEQLYKQHADKKGGASVLDAAVGVGDALTSGLSHLTTGSIATPTADLIARVTGNDAGKAKQWVNDNLIYHPQTVGGQGIADLTQKGVQTTFAPVSAAVQKTDQFVGDQFGPGVQQGVRDAAAVASDVASLVPFGMAAKQGVDSWKAANAAERANAAVARAPDEVAREAGYRLAPTDVRNATGVAEQPNVASRGLESASNRGAVVADYVRHNKGVSNDIAAQDIGLPAKTPLTDANLAEARKPFGAAYNEVRQKVGPTFLDKRFAEEIGSAGRTNGSVRPLPGAAQKEIDDLLARGKMSGQEMLGTISDLRSKGWKASASDNVDTAAVGDVQLDLAKALESQLDRASSAIDPLLGDKYRAARKGFAKIETVERARVGLDVDAQALRRAAAKTDAIDGGLAVIADTAEAFPKMLKRDVPEAASGVNGNSLSSMASNAVGTLGGRWLLKKTRGEAASPQLGPSGPLSYYYREPNKPGPWKPAPAPDLAQYPVGKGSGLRSVQAPQAPANIMGETVPEAPNLAAYPNVVQKARKGVQAPQMPSALAAQPEPVRDAFGNILFETPEQLRRRQMAELLKRGN